MDNFLDYQGISEEQKARIYANFGNFTKGGKMMWFCGPKSTGKTRFVEEMTRLRRVADYGRALGGFRSMSGNVLLNDNSFFFEKVMHFSLVVSDDMPLPVFEDRQQELKFYTDISSGEPVMILRRGKFSLNTPLRVPFVFISNSAPPKHLQRFFDVFTFPNQILTPCDADGSALKKIMSSLPPRITDEMVTTETARAIDATFSTLTAMASS